MSKSEWLEAKEFPNSTFFKLSPPQEKGGRPSYLFLAHHLLTYLPDNLEAILSSDEVETVYVEALEPIKEREQSALFFQQTQEVVIAKLAKKYNKALKALDEEKLLVQHVLSSIKLKSFNSEELISKSSPEKKDLPDDEKKITEIIRSLHKKESHEYFESYSDSNLRKKIFVDQTSAYIYKNLDELWQEMVNIGSQEELDLVFTFRNEIWMKTLSNQEGVIIAVGGSHALGPNGLLNQYKKLGYTIESLEAPITPEIAAPNAKKWSKFLDISYGTTAYLNQVIKKLDSAEPSLLILTQLQKKGYGLFDIFYIRQILIDEEDRSEFGNAVIASYTQLYQYLHELNIISDPEKWVGQWEKIKPYIVKKMFCFLHFVGTIDSLVNNLEFSHPSFLEEAKKDILTTLTEFHFCLLNTPLEEINSYTRTIQYHLDFMDQWSQTKINSSSLMSFLNAMRPLRDWKEIPLQEEKQVSKQLPQEEQRKPAEDKLQDRQPSKSESSQEQEQSQGKEQKEESRLENPIRYQGSVFAKLGSPSRPIDPQLIKECDAFNSPICNIFYRGGTF